MDTNDGQAEQDFFVGILCSVQVESGSITTKYPSNGRRRGTQKDGLSFEEHEHLTLLLNLVNNG